MRLAVTLAALLFGIAPASAKTLCEDPQGQCGKLMSADCFDKLGAGAITATTPAICQAQLDTYQSCLALVAENCAGASVIAPGGGGNKTFSPVYDFSQAKQSIRVDEFDVAFQGCKNTGGVVSCSMIVSNARRDEERRLRIFAEGSFIYDSFGIKYAGEQVSIGNKSDGREVGWNLPKNIPVQASVDFPASAFSGAEGTPLVQIFIDGSRRDFRNIAFD